MRAFLTLSQISRFVVKSEVFLISRTSKKVSLLLLLLERKNRISFQKNRRRTTRRQLRDTDNVDEDFIVQFIFYLLYILFYLSKIKICHFKLILFFEDNSQVNILVTASLITAGFTFLLLAHSMFVYHLSFCSYVLARLILLFACISHWKTNVHAAICKQQAMHSLIQN